MQWHAEWLASIGTQHRDLWRAVEAQHRVATMRLADSLDEQHLLEQLLEDSKPTLPVEAEGAPYLLSTPFAMSLSGPRAFAVQVRAVLGTEPTSQRPSRQKSPTGAGNSLWTARDSRTRSLSWN